MAETKSPEIRKIAAAKALRKLLADHFYELDRAVKEGHPKVAWCTSVGPAELPRAMSLLLRFPENDGAMLGAVANGMANAPGVWIKNLRITPEKLLRAIRDRQPVTESVAM